MLFPTFALSAFRQSLGNFWDHWRVADFRGSAQGEVRMEQLAMAISDFVGSDDGAALVEYAILIALIAVICLVVVATVGNKVSQKFSEVESKL
jgi:pilus assembly protein Flp/PilA